MASPCGFFFFFSPCGFGSASAVVLWAAGGGAPRVWRGSRRRGTACLGLHAGATPRFWGASRRRGAACLGGLHAGGAPRVWGTSRRRGATCLGDFTEAWVQHQRPRL